MQKIKTVMTFLRKGDCYNSYENIFHTARRLIYEILISYFFYIKIQQQQNREKHVLKMWTVYLMSIVLKNNILISNLKIKQNNRK